MIDWQAFTELSVPKNMLDIELQRMIAAQELAKHFFRFPRQTQAVEKCEKLVMGDSEAVCWVDLYACKSIPKFSLKRDYFIYRK